jgi:hypothetical protein
MRTGSADSAHNAARLERETAAAATAADFKKFLRERFAIGTPSGINESMPDA